MTNRKTVKAVIDQFVNGGSACPDLNSYGAVKVRDGALYSYRAKIAEWDLGDTEADGTLVIHDGWDGYSKTTSTHMKYLHDAVTRARFTTSVRTTGEGKGESKPRWHALGTVGVEK